ncbi:MAG: hypothetical protein SPF36_06885 [Lachnospiraceae bacterium]|jgi:hypothetical protein|nr:hypothetical protein [Lachnospiraceae bacterium]MCI6408248.1 hypothetical protein [Lachnospiraceae bacterium]MDD7223658.1 hypothetical protein [Lachnospiraceae bacterium]MDY5640812.1 hypothetical protein [Lachnospiraceae bacterium]
MKNRIVIFTLLILLLSLAGCEKKEEVRDINIENHYEEDLALIKSENSIPVKFVFVNVSGIDIGMLSIIDPSSKEQMNVAPVDNNSSIEVGANWPKEETKIYWALYNKDGELCIEGNSDITGIKESATIVLSGDGNVTDIDVQVN